MRDGAGDGNRTHVASLGSWSSTIELHPQVRIYQLPDIGYCIVFVLYCQPFFHAFTQAGKTFISQPFDGSRALVCETSFADRYRVCRAAKTAMHAVPCGYPELLAYGDGMAAFVHRLVE